MHRTAPHRSIGARSISSAREFGELRATAERLETELDTCQRKLAAVKATRKRKRR